MDYVIPRRDEQIAAALGAALEIEIRSDLIALPMYSGPAALGIIYEWVPDIDSIPEDDTMRGYADIAIISQIALNILPYWKLNYFKVRQSPSLKTERFEPDWDALEAALIGDRDGALDELNPEYMDSLTTSFTGFTHTHYKNDKPCCNPGWRRGW